jgi:hypothetical protein
LIARSLRNRGSLAAVEPGFPPTAAQRWEPARCIPPIVGHPILDQNKVLLVNSSRVWRRLTRIAGTVAIVVASGNNRVVKPDKAVVAQ